MARLLVEVSCLVFCAFTLAGCAGDFDSDEAEDDELTQGSSSTVSEPFDEHSDAPERSLPRAARAERHLEVPVPAPFKALKVAKPLAPRQLPDPPDPLLERGPVTPLEAR